MSIKIYVRLLEEGTEVFRPTEAIQIEENFYEILATPDYDPNDEIWEFEPGTIVHGRIETHHGLDLFVAHK